MMRVSLRNSIFLGVMFLLLSACGGGGNSDTTAPTATITTTAPAAPDPALITTGTVITVHFSESMDTTVGSWKLGGDLASESDGGVWSQDSVQNDTLTISPTSEWLATPNHSLIIDAQDLAGNAVATINLHYDVYRGLLYYVDASQPDDSGAGTNPLTARKYIHTAVADAVTPATVLVKAGDYRLSHALGTHIVLKEMVSLYGGYNADFTQRDPTSNVTTIEDRSNTAIGVISTTAALSHAAIVGNGTVNPITPATVIDGFTIQGSTQTGADYTSAISLTGASPTIQNNILDGGSGSNFSIGIYNVNYASPVVQDNTINGGSSSSSNYGMFNENHASPTVQNNTINGGSGTRSYGINNRDYSSTIVQNNLINGGGNSTYSYGIYYLDSAPMLQNNAIYGGDGATISIAIIGVAVATSTNLDISNNLIFTRTGSSSICIQTENTFVYNATPVTLRDNDLFNCSVTYTDTNGLCTGNGDGDNDPSTCTLTEMNALTIIPDNGGNISVNPMFASINGADNNIDTMADNDWHFSASSPASVTAGGLNGIDRGWSFTTDKDGVTRPASGKPWSIGAYEP